MFFSEINEIKTVLHPHQFCLFLHHNVSLNFNCLACPFEFLVKKKLAMLSFLYCMNLKLYQS